MHTVSYLSRLLAITDRQELNFKLHKARAWSVLNRFHSWIPECPLGIPFLQHCLGPVYMEWGTPVQWGRFLLFCVPQREIQNFRNIQNFLLACLSWEFRTSKKWYNWPFLTKFYPKKVTQNCREPSFLAEILEKVSLIPIIFRSLDFQQGNPNR